MQTINGEASTAEKISLICDAFVLLILIWDQIRYGLNMLYLIIPLILIGLYICFFFMIPEKYCFAEKSLDISHKLRKTVNIPYDSVFNYEASARDGFINIGQSNKVKLYCQMGRKKKAIVCRPNDVETFIREIRANCPEFQENFDNNSRIEVYFDNK